MADYVVRYRPATVYDRGVQTDPVELRMEELNYYKDNIKKPRQSELSDAGQVIGSSNAYREDHYAHVTKDKKSIKDNEMKVVFEIFWGCFLIH